MRLPATLPQADAGDDQVGLVGRRVTLNGRRSMPAGRLGFRWIQVEGPPVRTRIEESDLLTFLPEAPGVYRFGLVVADGSVISEPDFAMVAVVSEAPQAPRGPAAASRPVSPQEAARTALMTLAEGPRSAKGLAEAFEDVAGRIDLYSTYADLLQGSSSRLEAILPPDPARRQIWNERLFIPLSKRLIDDLRSAGLDLSRPEGLNVVLSPDHRTRLAEEFQSMARGFRSASPPENRPESPEPAKLDLSP
jgi:hypothetical protein